MTADIRSEILSSLSRTSSGWSVSSPGRLSNLPATHGAAAVRDEIEEMIYKDLADRARVAADALGYKDLAALAGRVVQNSGSY